MIPVSLRMVLRDREAESINRRIGESEKSWESEGKFIAGAGGSKK
jgi:hypothetical protein